MKRYLIISMVAGVAALIGLISFVGGIRPVNIGAFLFPLLIAAAALFLYIRTKNKQS